MTLFILKILLVLCVVAGHLLVLNNLESISYFSIKHVTQTVFSFGFIAIV